jgi:hypothetical protein
MKNYYDFESFYEKIEGLENKMKELPEKPKKPIIPKISETPSIKEIEEYKIKLDLYSNELKSFEKNMNDYELEIEKISDFNDSLWHCFHCNKGGDLLKLVQEKERRSD